MEPKLVEPETALYVTPVVLPVGAVKLRTIVVDVTEVAPVIVGAANIKLPL